MAEFTNGDDFEEWLEGKPRAWTVALAARSALRVLPLLSEHSKPSNVLSQSQRSKIILPVFRGMAIPWAVAKYSTQLSDLSVAAAAAAIAARTDVGGVGAAAASAARSVYVDRELASFGASTANCAADIVGSVGSKRIWKALSADARILVDTQETGSIIGLPLWVADLGWSGDHDELNGPSWIAHEWLVLRRSLLNEKIEDWQVWIDWYEARLNGRDPWSEAVEIACALIPDQVWKHGPAIVNAEIRAIREGGAYKQKPENLTEYVREVPSAKSAIVTKQIEELIAAVSPKPFVSDDGKLDAGGNPEFDRAVTSDELPSLPVRQQALIRTILSDFGANAPRNVRTAFEEYRDELLARGLQPILGLLNDMVSVISAACNAKNAASEWLDV